MKSKIILRVLLLKCPRTFGQDCTNHAALVRHQYSVLVKKKIEIYSET